MLAIESFGAAFPDIYMDSNLKVNSIVCVVAHCQFRVQGVVRLDVVAGFVFSDACAYEWRLP